MLADELPPRQNSIVFSRINTALHDEIAQQMREWEKRNRVKVYPIGATAEFQTINAKAEAVKRGGQNGANTTKLTAKLKRDEHK